MSISNVEIKQYISTALQLSDVLGSQLNRSIYLKNNGLALTKIALLKYDHNFHENVKRLEQRHNTELSDTLINMYEFLRDYCTPNNQSFKPERNDVHEKDCDCFTDDGKEMFFYKGILKKEKSFDENGLLKSTSYYDEDEKLNNIEEFDGQGFLKRSLIFENNKIKYEYFHKKDKSIYLFKRKSINTRGESKTFKIRLFDDVRNKVYEFENEKGLWLFFLDILVGNEQTIVTSDQIKDFNLIENFYHEKIYKGYFIHNSDCNYDHNKYKIIGMDWASSCEQLSKPDAIIFTTEAQTEDFAKYYGNRNNIFDLPILMDFENDSEIVTRQKNRIIACLSNEDVMELELLIRSFRMVVDKKPKSSLIVYGFTSPNEIVDKLIKKLDLGGNIVIEYNLDIDNVDINQMYKSATASVFIKEQPDIELEILRSLRNGCPVIAYDFNYDTTELINNGENGFVIQRNSITYLGNAIDNLLTLQESMKSNASQLVDWIHKDDFLKKWDRLSGKLISNRYNKNLITDVLVYLDDFKWNNKTLNVATKVYVTGEVNPYTEPNVYLGVVNRQTGQEYKVYGEVEKINDLLYRYGGYVDLQSIDLAQGTWDLVLYFQWENCFFKKRVGHYKNEINLKEKIINNRMVTPYFTEKGDNISIKLGKFITEEKKLES